MLAACVIEASDNDDTTGALSLAFTEEIAGSGLLQGCATGEISPSGDVDYWRIEAVAGDQLTVHIRATSSLDTYLELRNSADGYLTANDDGGPGYDSLISNYLINSSGTYYLRVNGYRSSTGTYRAEVDIGRSVDLENDSNSQNDTLGGATPISLSPLGTTLEGDIAGNLFTAADQDVYDLGFRNGGNTVNLTIATEIGSTLSAMAEVIDSSGTSVLSVDGDGDDSTFEGTLPSSGRYFARVTGDAGGRYLLQTQILDTIEPSIVSLSGLPAENETTDQPTIEFTLGFDEPLAINSVASANFDLVSSGPDGQFDTLDDVSYDLQISPAYTGGTSVSLLVTDGPLDRGDYRLTVASSVTDVVGNPLDGNGDGTGGDALVRHFTIDFPDVYQLESGANGSLAEATAVPLTEELAGSGLAIGRGLGAIDPAGDQDWWSFEAQAGDRIAVAVDRFGDHQALDSEIYLYDSTGNYLASERDAGPGASSYYSHYQVDEDGTYYVRVFGDSTSNEGTYQLRIERARGIDLESDGSYNNDSIANADPITLTASGTIQVGTVAGTLMGPEGANIDEDVYALGTFSAGNQVELDIRTPSADGISAIVRLLDAAGNVIPDVDGDLTDGHFLATLTQGGAYFAEVTRVYQYQGHRYYVGSHRSWQ
ncbi:MULTISPECIES: pre-peptidase C-terminal domain-containing protein, partial [Pirellulaceae]